MALYRRGTASMDADGTVHGTDTKWKDQLALIRVGATIVFLEQPIKLAVISDIVSDTELKAISTDGQTAANGKYVILLNDSLTVNGLAQNVAETLRYYQSKETEIAGAMDIIASLDMDNLNRIVEEIKANKSAAESAQNQAELARDSANAARDEAKATKGQVQQIVDGAVGSINAAKEQAITDVGSKESAAITHIDTEEKAAIKSINDAKGDLSGYVNNAQAAAKTATSAKNDAQAARDAAVSAKDAAAVSAQEAKDAANSVEAKNLLHKDKNLSDVADKDQSKKNLAVNRFNQPRADLTEVYSNDDRNGFKLIVKDNGDWGAMKHDGSENKALGVNFGGTGGVTGPQARANLNVFKRDKTALGGRDLDSIDGSGDNPGVYFQASSAAATSARHYPEATAGMLEVFQHGANGESGAIQRYTPFTILTIAPEGSQEYARAGKGTFYVRSKNGNSPKWSPWLPFQTGLYGGVVSYPGTNERSSWTDYVNVVAAQPSSMGTYNIRQIGWVNAISSRHRNGTGDGSNYGVIFADEQMAATHYKNITVRKQVAGNWINPVTLWHNGNTTVDGNGFVKRASPIVKVFGSGKFETNDESEGCEVNKVGVGEYLITGCIALNSDLAWGGVRGGIEVPKDINGQPILWVDYDVNADGSILLKTFHREHLDAPEFARNKVQGYSNGDPIDIPTDVFVSVRVDMPEDSIYNMREREMSAISKVELST